jgi:hypothetical protein
MEIDSHVGKREAVQQLNRFSSTAETVTMVGHENCTGLMNERVGRMDDGQPCYSTGRRSIPSGQE